jgi:MSHA pilin protein MshC
MHARVSALLPPQFSRGYTVIELVLVIVILAILGAVAGPRFFDNAAFDERGYYDELTSALRYAQKVAVASGCPVQVVIGVSGYALSQQSSLAGHCDPGDTSYPVPVRLPTGEVMSGTAPSGVTTAPATTLVYGALGQTSLAGNQAFTIGARVLSIQAESGLVVTP